jgi:chorismate dehydratase
MLPHPFEIEKDVPSALIEGLRTGRYDIALASSASLLTLGDEYSYIPGIGICSDGPVASVCIFHKGSPGKLNKVYLDPASRTGNALSKIILEQHLSITPEYIDQGNKRPSPEALTDGEGCVLIGDSALVESTEFYYRIDLGDSWKQMTGLPFVYALWIGRKDVISDRISIPLYNAHRLGKAVIPEIIESSTDLPVSRDIAENYLRNHIQYDVTEDAEAGLGRFLRLAGEYI